MAPNSSRRRLQAGFTLLEAMIAIAILSFGILSRLPFTLRAFKWQP